MGKRTLVNDPSFTANDLQHLSTQILDFITEQVRQEHLSAHEWHHAGSSSFFTGHRQFIGKLETALQVAGFSRFIPLPKWDPATTIPIDFRRVKMLPAVVSAGLGEFIANPSPNLPLPDRFTNLTQYATAEDLSRDLYDWHGMVHMTVGGAMAPLMLSPCAVVFWLWHAFIDDVYEDWLNRSDVRRARLLKRIGVLKANGEVYVKEGSVNAIWGGLQLGGIGQISLADKRIGVLTKNGEVFVKEGSLDALWGGLQTQGVKQIALTGDRLGVLKNNGDVIVKEGPLNAIWGGVQTGDVKQLALAGKRIGVLKNNGDVIVKEGPLDAIWGGGGPPRGTC